MPTQTGTRLTLRLLSKSRNPAAIEVLDAGLQAPSAALRSQVAQAMAARSGRESAFALLRALPESPADVSQACREPDVCRRLRAAAAEAILSDDEQLATCGCYYAETCGDAYLTPSLVERARRSSVDRRRYVQAAHGLVVSVADAIEHPPGVGAKRDEDPAFARRAALSALGPAVDEFATHHQQLLVEAYLMLAPSGDPRLARILKDPSHPAHEVVRRTLKNSRHRAVMRLLQESLLLDRPCKVRCGLLRQRKDVAFLAYWISTIGDRPSPRLVEQIADFDGFAWTAERDQAVLLKLEGTTQAAAIHLAARTRLSRRRLTEIAAMLLKEGKVQGRVGAVEVLAGVNATASAALAKEALSDQDPLVVAAARRLLKQGGEHPQPHAAPDAPVGTKRSSLPPLAAAAAPRTFRVYRDRFAHLDPVARLSLGRCVAREDPTCPAELRIELKAASSGRRVQAIEMACSLGLQEAVTDELIGLLADRSAAVRAAAARALAGSTRDDVIAGLTLILQDVDEAVREIAARSLRDCDAQDPAARIDRAMRGEEAGYE